MELEYRNISKDTLSEIHFTLDKSCRIDSILYYGSPLTEDALTYDSSILKVSLPQKLVSGETGFFLMSFETKLAPTSAASSGENLSVTYGNWCPRVCIYRDGQWYCDKNHGEYADYNVYLEIDSSYSIAHPGELWNKKEHYGLLPTAADDTIYVDLLNEHSLGLNGVKYYPTFEGGVKRYSIRARNVTGFPFVVGTEFLRDRTSVGSLTIEVCYPQEVKAIWAGFVARSVVGLVRQLQKRLGDFLHHNLTIVAGDASHPHLNTQQLIVLPSSITDTDSLYTALAGGLANCWPPPAALDSSNMGLPFVPPETSLCSLDNVK
jgi:hypothetical protein